MNKESGSLRCTAGRIMYSPTFIRYINKHGIDACANKISSITEGDTIIGELLRSYRGVLALDFMNRHGIINFFPAVVAIKLLTRTANTLLSVYDENPINLCDYFCCGDPPETPWG